MGELINLTQAAELLGISHSTLYTRYRLYQSGLPVSVAKNSRNHNLYRREDFIAYRQKMTKHPSGVDFNQAAQAYLKTPSHSTPCFKTTGGATTRVHVTGDWE